MKRKTNARYIVNTLNAMQRNGKLHKMFEIDLHFKIISYYVVPNQTITNTTNVMIMPKRANYHEIVMDSALKNSNCFLQ